MKKTREEKAITLIALIITIVVLLILAVVAINAVTGDGIIQHATNAKTEYEKAEAEEESILSYYEGYLENKGNVGPWRQSGKELIRDEGNGNKTVLKIGQVVEYNPCINEKGEDIDPTYTSKEDESGIIENQEFKASDYENGVWKVLGIENGNILLLSADNVSNEYTLLTHNVYIAGDNILNNICGIYGYGKGAKSARSITVEDVNKITGYNPETMKMAIKDKGHDGNKVDGKYINKYGDLVTFTASEDGSKITYTNENGEIIDIGKQDDFAYIKDNEWKRLGAKETITIEQNYYRYFATKDPENEYKGMNMSIDSEEYKLLFRDSANEKDTKYYLASKVNSLDYPSGWQNLYNFYGLRIVNKGKVGQGKGIFEPGNSTVTLDGIRAVVELNSEVQLIDNDYDGNLEII